jgi:TolB-like protein/Flp pilus assembly protein TadD
VLFILEQRAGPASEKILLVVLPFENLGPEEEEYFADGVADEITTRLAGIHGLGVISRHSAMQYKKTKKSVQQIAEELGVDYILEGTVQRERPSDPSSRVRITPRLIRASDDMQVWAEPYDFMGGVFQVQSDVAELVAKKLDLALLEPERRAMTYRPTENPEAYDYYLQGHHYRNRSIRESDLIIAVQMYDKAVELDPEYALAYAQLSRCHAMMYWQYYDHTPERLKMAWQQVQKALQLEPDLPEAHLALGHYYYSGKSDWDRALDEFAIARKSLPNDSDLLSFIGFVQRRQGKFQEALANIKNASELNPRSNNITISLGETLMYMRNYPEAMSCFDKAISLAPDVTRPYGYKASLYLLWGGSTKKARAVVNKALATVGLPERSAIFNLLINLDVYDGNYQDALRRVSSRSEDIDSQDFFIPVAMQYASIYGHMEDDLAKKYYDKVLEIVKAKIQQEPDDARLHSALGIAYAGLGRRQEAIREGRLAADLLPIGKDAMRGTYRVGDLARIYVMVGDFDLAVDQIAFLLSIPSELSIDLLRLDPAWNPLRGHARFQKLLEGK